MVPPIKDTVENVTYGIRIGRLILQKALPKRWSRVLLPIFMCLIVVGPFSGFHYLVVDELSASSDTYYEEQDLVDKELKERKSLDYIQLCMDAATGNDPNKGYYCGYAVELYKEAFIDYPGSDVEKNIDLSAYGAMKVEMASRLRLTMQMRTNQAPPRMTQQLKLLLQIGLWASIIVGTSLALGTMYLMHRMQRNRLELEDPS